jgi:hypothetical protein
LISCNLIKIFYPICTISIWSTHHMRLYILNFVFIWKLMISLWGHVVSNCLSCGTCLKWLASINHKMLLAAKHQSQILFFFLWNLPIIKHNAIKWNKFLFLDIMSTHINNKYLHDVNKSQESSNIKIVITFDYKCIITHGC